MGRKALIQPAEGRAWRFSVVATQYRHGDVFLLKVKGIPAGAKEIQRDRVVLAEGEVTGHAHRIDAPTVVLWEVEGQRYVTVPEGASLTHEEHGVIPLEPGDYLARIQRVYAPDEVRNVAD
jgi:hypothetical protein